MIDLKLEPIGAAKPSPSPSRSPSAAAHARERIDGRRALEQLALMSVDQSPRDDPYRELAILSLAESPARSRSKPSERTRSGERNAFEVAGSRETARPAENSKPLLL